MRINRVMAGAVASVLALGAVAPPSPTTTTVTAANGGKIAASGARTAVTGSATAVRPGATGNATAATGTATTTATTARHRRRRGPPGLWPGLRLEGRTPLP